MNYCHICKKELDNPDDYTSADFGGCCIECMAEAGSLDCIAELKRLEEAEEYAEARDPD